MSTKPTINLRIPAGGEALMAAIGRYGAACRNHSDDAFVDGPIPTALHEVERALKQFIVPVVPLESRCTHQGCLPHAGTTTDPLHAPSHKRPLTCYLGWHRHYGQYDWSTARRVCLECGYEWFTR